MGLKTQFVTSIRDMHANRTRPGQPQKAPFNANRTREYNQSVSKVCELLNSRCKALIKTQRKSRAQERIASGFYSWFNREKGGLTSFDIQCLSGSDAKGKLRM